MSEASVVSVNISDVKGTSKHPVPEITLISGGVVGDAHAGQGFREVSLLSAESIQRFGAETDRTYTYGEFAENITTQGLNLAGAHLLDRIVIGEAILEVTNIGKRCHGEGCAIYRDVGRCVMPTEGIFCRVMRGGPVKADDHIELHPRTLRAHIITLSDRASRGIYPDRSGPAIKTRLEQFCRERNWMPAIEMTLLPDDAAGLKNELATARDNGVDIVITTGGTGIGPRDVTPDVVMALADKLIPGIMEHIRCKYGDHKPNVRLSRSVAAVMGQTLIYTLPGSVTAVNEYLSEILETMEHCMLTLRGIDLH